MRIVPYESAAVKVRVEAEALKLAQFLYVGSKEPVFAGRVDSRIVDSLGTERDATASRAV